MNFIEYVFGWDLFLFACTLMNLIIAGIYYFPVFAAGCIALAALPPWRLAIYRGRLGKLALFFFMLLLIGALFSNLWTFLVYNRFYYSTDYCGTDFYPFWPIAQSLIDAPMGNERGELMGVTLFQLNLIWFVFALGTWVTTVAAYRQIRKKCEAASQSLPLPVLST